jgi:PAS domain S-box-containing protein
MNHIPPIPDAKLHLEAIIRWSDDAIVSKDLRGIITTWNLGAERMFGYTAAEAVGKSIMMIIPADRRKEEEHVLHQVMGGHVVDHFETVRLTKDGRQLDISLTVSPIKDASGKIIGASKIARDVTERKRTEKAYLQLLEERSQVQKDAARMKDEFLAMLSHELRTPLASIMGWTELLITGELTAEQSKEALDTIRRNVRTQSTILGDLLDLSRITQGMLNLELVPVNLERILQDAMDVVKPAASAKRIEIELHRGPQVYPVFGDALRLQQAIWNVLTNAIKFTPQGGRIDIRLEREDRKVRVAVTDTGEGIAADFIPHVFSRFRQADTSRLRSHGGLGLGLALVREIINLHGGSATVQSPGVGQGTTVTIELPENESAALPSAPQAAAEPSIDSLGGLRVLVVDDRLDDRELLKVILQQAGATVRTASSSMEALGTLQSWRPNLLISDLAMPQEGGFGLITKVRALEDPELRRTPAIAVTAHLGLEDRTQALQAGFEHYLMKPIERNVLLGLVGRMSVQPQT